MVVYLLIPTSNHNRAYAYDRVSRLFISWFLHQTTTDDLLDDRPEPLFISWFLHQTTTHRRHDHGQAGCLSLDSYIKPQPGVRRAACGRVVYLLIPTSNHNQEYEEQHADELFISWFLHQTTTNRAIICFLFSLFISWFLHQTTTRSWTLAIRPRLFISWFLHQTTTARHFCIACICCLSLDSYIKPQPPMDGRSILWVVYLLIPTSNHNWPSEHESRFGVVYLLIPTSNHNRQAVFSWVHTLFISWFLHQTTTDRDSSN